MGFSEIRGSAYSTVTSSGYAAIDKGIFCGIFHFSEVNTFPVWRSQDIHAHFYSWPARTTHLDNRFIYLFTLGVVKNSL